MDAVAALESMKAELLDIDTTDSRGTGRSVDQAPRARVVYIIPIAGTLLASGAVGFLMNERRLARKAVAELNETFQRVCRGV
jgi:hypothetical protein